MAGCLHYLVVSYVVALLCWTIALLRLGESVIVGEVGKQVGKV